MIDELRDHIAATCNQLPFVTWDRFVDWETGLLIYGWIDRDDGRKDFVTLQFTAHEFSFFTSSAKHSREIASILQSYDGDHVDCQRVDTVFGGLIPIATHEHVRDTSPERLAAIANCPTPYYHETHRYCPSCPWTEQDDAA